MCFRCIPERKALWGPCIDYCACAVIVCIRNEGVRWSGTWATVERQVVGATFLQISGGGLCSTGCEGLKTMTSGFGGKNLRTSRANFEGLRAISECGTGFYRACGLKNGHFRF